MSVSHCHYAEPCPFDPSSCKVRGLHYSAKAPSSNPSVATFFIHFCWLCALVLWVTGSILCLETAKVGCNEEDPKGTGYCIRFGDNVSGRSKLIRRRTIHDSLLLASPLTLTSAKGFLHCLGHCCCTTVEFYCFYRKLEDGCSETTGIVHSV